MKYIVRNKYLFYILQFTWGIVGNLIGVIVLLVLIPTISKIKYEKNNLRIVNKYKLNGNFSLGIFCFMSNYNFDFSYKHEIGHSLQNAVYGVAYLLIALCSVIRFWYREIRIKLGYQVNDYYSIWYEKEASKWGCYYD